MESGWQYFSVNVSVDQVGSKDSDPDFPIFPDRESKVSVDQVGSKDSDSLRLIATRTVNQCPLIRLVPRTATNVYNVMRSRSPCPLIRLVPRTATAVSYEACVYWV